MVGSQRSNVDQGARVLLSPDLAAVQTRTRLALLVPVFNGQDALERSLASLRESEEKFDVFVVDDGSDPPIETVANLPFTIELIRLPKNGGITRALNAGLARIMTRGYEYVGRLDAGDVSLPGRLEAQVAFLDAHPDHAAVGTHAEYVARNGTRLFIFRPPDDHEALTRYLKRRNGIVHASVVMRTACLVECGGYDERYCGAEDYELWCRLGQRYKLANVPEVLFQVEVHDASITARRFRSLTRLNAQLRHFDPLSLNAYLGILRSLVALSIDRRIVLRMKQLKEKWMMRKRQEYSAQASSADDPFGLGVDE